MALKAADLSEREAIMKAIMGNKLRMTQMFTEDGKRIPLTAIKVGPCPVVQVKQNDGRDRYNAVQIGYEKVKEKSLTKPEIGHFQKADLEPHRHLREVRVDSLEGYEVGKVIDASVFEAGDRVDVTGTSKGRGFQGGVRRYNWGGGRETHGSMFHRGVGAISPGTGQARVFPGKNLPGQMGNETVTVQNLEIIEVDADHGIVYVKGAIPGPNGGLVFVKQTTKGSN